MIGLDPGPAAGTDSGDGDAGFVGRIETRFHGQVRIERQIAEYLRRYVGVGGGIVIAVVNIVGDGGDHFGLQQKIEKRVGRC